MPLLLPLRNNFLVEEAIPELHGFRFKFTFKEPLDIEDPIGLMLMGLTSVVGVANQEEDEEFFTEKFVGQKFFDQDFSGGMDFHRPTATQVGALNFTAKVPEE